MRLLGVVATTLCLSCESSVSLDVDGGLRFACSSPSLTSLQTGNCPGQLFCAADGQCRSKSEGGSYACRGDFGCGGVFRCGPNGVCLDPTADALRSDAPMVTLSLTARKADPHKPWGPPTALGIGATYSSFFDGPLVDVSPLSLAQGTEIYTVAISRAGFTQPVPPERVFVGHATVLRPVIDVASVRNQVFALTDAGLYVYSWEPLFDGGTSPQLLDAGTPIPRVGDRLRVGNSAFPFIMEFSNDGGEYRVFDTAAPTYGPGPVQSISRAVDDMVDTDTQIYAAMDGVLFHSLRSTSPGFTAVPLVSPGRDFFLTNCGGSGSHAENYYIRAIHVGNDPDLTSTQPLVALEVDVTLKGDGGVLPTRWMRVDPAPDITFGCNPNNNHVVRGNCDACGPGEALIDLQWGVDELHQPALRSECRAAANLPSVFYDLQTDATGFACFQTPRLDVGYRGTGNLVRSRSSAIVRAVAVGDVVYTRRDGFARYVPLTLERPPRVAQVIGGSLVALCDRTMYRDSPILGLALSSFGDVVGAFPTWISDDLLFYDDGHVGPLFNLAMPPQAGTRLAVPSRGDLAQPISGRKMKVGDGRDFVVMTANDALLGADLSRSAPGAPAPIDVKVVPEAQVPILSVAPAPLGAPDAGLFGGFVLTQNRAFAMRATTEQQWDVTPIDVPPGQPLEVWTDGERGRVGFTNGAVYALPSGVLLADPFGKALDYQVYCGRAYVLSEDFLYRLDAVAGSGVGTWSKETTFPTGKKWARLYVYGSELWAFAQDGSGVELKGAPCTP